MPKTYIEVNSLNAGEVSPLVAMRSDISKYRSACNILENSLPLVEGGAKKMPGTYFAGATGLGGAMFIGSISGTTMTITEVIYGTIRVGQVVTGPNVSPNTIITAYDPNSSSTTITTYFNVTKQSAWPSGQTANGSIWNADSNEWRSYFNPGTSTLSELTFHSFGLNIPSNAVILGVESSTGLISQSETNGTLSQVALWNSGGLVGTIKTPGTPFTHPSNGLPVQESYGSSTDVWEATLTPNIVNDPSFGFAMAAQCDSIRVFIAPPFTITIYYSITTTVTTESGQPGGVGNYTVSTGQNVSSEQMQTASTGKSRLVPFQFSEEQGAILELSAGIVRIWEGATQGSWSLGIALQTPPSGVSYSPVTSYVPGNIVLVGPYASALNYTQSGSVWTPNPSLGVLSFAAPYGTSFSNSVPITFTTNSSDSLSVTTTGISPNQGINIALANTTSALNSAASIQAGIQALGTLNSVGNNYVDLTGWTVTPDPIYSATPWITAPAIAPSSSINLGFTESFITQCVAANLGTQFPVLYTGYFDAIYWAAYNATAQLPIELTTPYSEDDLFNLDCSTQSADVLWVFHIDYPPACIERLGANSWQYSTSLPGQEANEPSYRGTLDVVKTGYSALGQNISLISQSYPCTVVLASPSTSQPFSVGDRIYINEGSGLVELNEGEFLVASIAYGSTAIHVVDSAGTGSNVTATGWYMTLTDPDTGVTIDSTSYLQYEGGGFAVKVVPLFAATGDYPSCGTLYQERLIVGGSDNNPTQLNGSVEDDYPDFIADPNEDDYAIQYTLVSNQVNRLLNMVGTPNALLVGTSGGIWVIQGSGGSSSSLSQTNVSAVVQSSLGVSNLQPQLVNGSGIFVSRSTRIVTFLLYNFSSNTWENIDLTRLNRNITIGQSESESGVCQTAFQMEAYPIFWAVRNDGQLIGLVFNTQDQVFSWFRVDMTAENGYIESAAVLTGSGQEDQLVVVVRRTVNGVVHRFIEYFMPQELFGQLSNAFFVYCGQQWQGAGPFNITGITNANPPLVTAPRHTLTNGMMVRITGVEGMTEINQSATQAYTVTNANNSTFSLEGMDTTNFGAYTGGGQVEQVANQVTGMSYLLGNNVVAVGDGAVILEPTKVTTDTVMFPYYANLITIGIPYTVTIQPTNPVLSSQGATTRGMPQKLNRVTLSLYQAMGGQYGEDPDHMYDITYGPGTKSETPQISTAEFTRDMDCDWTEESTFFVKQSDPLPFTLRGIVFRMSANPD